MKLLHRADLFGWSRFDETRNIDFHSVAWVRPQGNVVVDPLPMTAHDMAHLRSLGGAALVIVTNSDHTRDAPVGIRRGVGRMIRRGVGRTQVIGVPTMILPKVRDPRFVTLRRGGTLTDADHQLLALWAAACAEHVLDMFESAQPEDPRPRQAIEQARAWVRGEVKMTQARAAANVESRATARRYCAMACSTVGGVRRAT